MSVLKEVINSTIKKFEIFERFYQYNKDDIDFKTRVDEYEIDDITFLHTLHNYWLKMWNYESPLEPYLERKKRLRVSRGGQGRIEMQRILADIREEEKEKTTWEKLVGT